MSTKTTEYQSGVFIYADTYPLSQVWPNVPLQDLQKGRIDHDQVNKYNVTLKW